MRQRNKQSTIKQRNKTRQGKTRQASKNNNQEQKNNQRLTTSNHEQEETIKSANISRPHREIIGESNVNDLQPHRTSCAESLTWWCFGAKLMNSFSDYVFGRSPAYYHHMRCEHVCVFYRRYQVVKLLYTIVYTRARRTIMDHRALESSALAGPCLTPGNLRGVAQNPQLRPFTLRS